MKIRNLIIYVFTALMLFSVAGAKYKTVKPAKKNRLVTVISNGKKFKYYRLSSSKETLLNLRGPGTLKVNTREILKSAKGKGYTIQYSVDGSPFKTIKIEGPSVSKKSRFKVKSLGRPSVNKPFKIKLGRGYHTIKIRISSASGKTIARFLFEKGKTEKERWTDLEPSSKSEMVELIVKEGSYQYYRFSYKKPLEIKIIGPTKVRILTRMENSYDMRGRVHYRIQVKEDGKVKNTYQLSSVKSDVTYYADNDELTPGKAREILIDVPKGKHVYRIYPLDKDKGSVLANILFPRKDTRLKR